MSTFFDVTILIVALIFAVMGVKDGLIREVFRFGALLGGFFAGFCYYQDLAVHLKAVSSNPKAVSITAFIIIFLVVAVLILILGFIVRKLINFAFLGVVDRILGLALGLLKAALITWVVCLNISLMPEKKLEEGFGKSVVYKTYKGLPAFFSIDGIENTKNKIRRTAAAGTEKIHEAGDYIETLINTLEKDEQEASKNRQK